MRRLLLAITDACNARCHHCLAPAPAATTRMSPEEIDRYLTTTRPRECVVITGGEPMLAPELVVAAARHAAEHGIAAWLNTNGFWGKEPRGAAAWARQLKAASVTRVNLSVDGLHQEWIPLTSVLNAIDALRDAGIAQLVALVTFVGEPGAPQDAATARILERLERERDLRVDVRRRISYIGRALDAFVESGPTLTFEQAMADGCELEGSDGLPDPLATRSFYTVTPQGRVELCDGICFPGDLRSQAFAELVNPEAVAADPLLRALQAEGVGGIVQRARASGFTPRARYLSKCHLCTEARRWLAVQRC